MDRPPPPPVDLLSSLPEHLQDEILTRLDLRDAVGTSAFSHAWRRRWETIPGLVLSFPDGTPGTFVYRVLLRLPSTGFVTHVDKASTSQVDDWLIALSHRSIESITILNKPRGGALTIHSSIFSCDRLVSLRLEHCCIPPLPQRGGFAGFPVLKELYLAFIWFADHGESPLRPMIRASPMLRVLFFEKVYATDMDYCVIEAPNLQSLGLISSYTVWQFGDLPRLQYASINVPEYLDGCILEFLTGVSQVEELIFKQPVCFFDMDAIPFTFSNLKRIELSTDLNDMDNILLMFCLLRSSPNLEKIKIELQEPKTTANRKFLSAQWTDGMCANLQVVEIIGAKGWLPLSFMKLVLSKASHLCIMSVDACPVSHDDRLNGLLNCTSASPQVQVLFKDEILTRLDLRHAVRTSTLSRAWRRRWETIPRLALSFPKGTPASVVYGVLLCYAGPSFSQFETCVEDSDEESDSHVAHWLIEISRRSVESISILNDDERKFTIHSSIFSCDHLVSLYLDGCRIPPLPQPGGFAGFPVLKDLHLTFVEFAGGDSQLGAIIRASPMLRILVLEDMFASDMNCVIEVPNLHTLGLIGSMDWRFGKLPCLQYGCIDVLLDFPGVHSCFVEYLAIFSQARELVFSLLQPCFKMTDTTSFTFSNLNSMELITDFHDNDNILLVFFLLSSSPKLEKLKIELRELKTVASQKFLNAQWTDGMCANLQVVEITSVKGCLPLSFMKLILSRASLLRTLSVDKCPVSLDDPLNELLNCRRASPQAEVQFKDQLERIRFNYMKFAEKRLN